MIGPEVRSEVAALYCPGRYGLDPLGKLRTTPLPPLKHPPKVLIGKALTPHADEPLEFSNREGEKSSRVHTLNTKTYWIRVKPTELSLSVEKSAEHGEMDRWPQRNLFKKAMQAYQKRTGKTQEDIAAAIGVGLGHMRNALYKKEKTLGHEVRIRAAALFGSPPLEFIDAQETEVDGQDLSDLSGQARFFATVIVKDLKAEDLNDEDRQELWEDFQRGLARIRKRRAGASNRHPDR